VVPTRLYLNGGGDTAPLVQPVHPAPALPALPLPGVFFLNDPLEG
jgi:hypothetical protein